MICMAIPQNGLGYAEGQYFIRSLQALNQAISVLKIKVLLLFFLGIFFFLVLSGPSTAIHII